MARSKGVKMNLAAFNKANSSGFDNDDLPTAPQARDAASNQADRSLEADKWRPRERGGGDDRGARRGGGGGGGSRYGRRDDEDRDRERGGDEDRELDKFRRNREREDEPSRADEADEWRKKEVSSEGRDGGGRRYDDRRGGGGRDNRDDRRDYRERRDDRDREPPTRDSFADSSDDWRRPGDRELPSKYNRNYRDRDTRDRDAPSSSWRDSRDSRDSRFDRRGDSDRFGDDRRGGNERFRDDRHDDRRDERPAHLRFRRDRDESDRRDDRDRPSDRDRRTREQDEEPSNSSSSASSSFSERQNKDDTNNNAELRPPSNQSPSPAPSSPSPSEDKPRERDSRDDIPSRFERPSHSSSSASSSSSSRIGGAPLEPVRLGRGSGLSLEEKFAARKEQRAAEASASSSSRYSSSSSSGRYSNDVRFSSRNTPNLDEPLPRGPAATRIETPLPSSKATPPQPADLKPKVQVTTDRWNEELAQASVVAKDEKYSALEKAVSDKSSINVDQLAAGLARLDLNEFEASSIGVVIARSLSDGSLKFSDALEKIKGFDEASELLIETLVAYQNRTSERELDQMVKSANAQDSVLSIIAPKLSGEELDGFLHDHNLIILKPVADLNEPIAQLLESHDVQKACDLIKSTVANPKVPVTYLLPSVSTALWKGVFADKTSVNTELIDRYAPLLQRIIQKNEHSSVQLLTDAQNIWFKAGAAKGQLKESFIKLFNNSILRASDFSAWKDQKDKAASKPKALLQVSSWIVDIQPKVKEPEYDSEDDAIGAEIDNEYDLPPNPNKDN